MDDNHVNLMVTCSMLDHWNVRYKCAADGNEAIDKWQRLKPDLILMDIQMPVCDGYDATRQIRNIEGGKTRVPIIALTGDENKYAREQCIDAGMDDFISKPFEPDDLYIKLLKWLED